MARAPRHISAARRTLTVPGSTELVIVPSHEITLDHRPSISVLVDGQQVAILQLGLAIVFDLNALLLEISGGRLTSVRSGRCDITATLAVQGTDLLVKRAHLELRGVISPRRESGSCPPSNTRPPRRKRKTPVPGLPSPGGMRARTPRRTRLPCAVRGYAVCGCPVGGGAVGPAPTHGNALTRSIPTRRWTWGRTCGPLRMSAGRMR
jgi:hypothetical protein